MGYHDFSTWEVIREALKVILAVLAAVALTTGLYLWGLSSDIDSH